MTPTTVTPKFIRPDQAAEYLSISRRHLCDLTRRGIVPACRVGRRCTVYAVADLDSAMMKLRTPEVGSCRT